MQRASKSELRSRLEALQQAREGCEERKIELFRAVNKLKQDLQEGLIDEQRYNQELAKLPKSPQQIISECNAEIAAIESGIASCREQLDSLREDKKNERLRTAAILAMLLLFSVGLPLLTIKLTGFIVSEEVTAYTQDIGTNFTASHAFALNVERTGGVGELRSLLLGGKLIGDGKVRVYLERGTERYLILNETSIIEKGATTVKALTSITGQVVAEQSSATATAAIATAEAKAEKAEEKTDEKAKEKEKGGKAGENATAAAANETQNLTQNETLNETQPPAAAVPEPEVPEAAVEKAINVSLAYKSGTIFDSNDDGIELDIFAIDFTVENSNFSWNADASKLCTRWVTKPSDSDAATAVCYGSSECCALIGLSPHEQSWKDAFYVFVGRDGATYNNTVSSQVIFANYSLDPANVYSEIYYSSFGTLPAAFVTSPPLEGGVTNETNVTVTVVEFSNICVETCSLAGIAGLNLSEYSLVIEVENATLELDNATYTLAKVTEIDIEPPIVTITQPRDITYTETITVAEARNTTTLRLEFTVSEPASSTWYSLNSQDNVTITAGTAATATTTITTTITAANGTNTLTLYATDLAGNVGYAVAEFFINFTTATVIDTEPPLITISSPLPNATYNTTAVALNFAISEPAAVSYFLNLQNKTEITSNTTMAVEDGRNRLLLLATDLSGNVAHESVVFFVNTSNITAVNITPLLKAKKKHFKLGEDAELEFEYISDNIVKELEKRGNVFRKAAEGSRSREWVTENETLKAVVLDSEGKLTSLEPQIGELREGKFDIKLQKQRQFRAGLYTLAVTFTKDNTTYLQQQNFTWGVLAINTNKSIFLPNEDAFIAMAVLNDQGHMVCDAGVTLTITDPAGAATTLTTAAGQIIISPECKVYGVTNLPDYYTNYTVNGVGTYIMNLTAATANGIRTITDNFTVQSQVDFDVARSGPTRIYPPVPYNMSFAIRASKSYNGAITEFVPASFNITPQQGLVVTTVAAANAKALSWNVQLKKGDRVSLSYEFDAPDVSPEFYLLGELGIGTWKEARQWQVASDAVSLTDDSFVIVPTSINIGELVNLTGTYSAGGGGGNCWINLTVTEDGTLITTSSSTAVKLVDIFFVAPCDRKTLATGRVECDDWAATNDNIPINFTVNGTTGGGGSKTYTTAKQAGCTITIDASDTLTVNAPADTTPPNVTIIVPPRLDINNTNVSGSFVINASVNDSESNVFQVNLTVYNNTGNATDLVQMNISSGTRLSGYWNVTFDSTTLRDARYNLSVNATDSAATPNTAISANVSIIIDNTVGNASIFAPAVNVTNTTTLSGSNTLSVNVNANDSLAGVFNVRAVMRKPAAEGTFIELSLSTGNIYDGRWTGSLTTDAGGSDGLQNVSILVNDTAGNIVRLNLSTVMIENTKPNTTIVAPLNNTNISATLLINASVNDTLSKVANVSFRLNNNTDNTTAWLLATNSTGTFDQGYWNTTFDTTTIRDANYNITINATDYAGNQQVINISTITIDNTAPNGTILTPANATNIRGFFTINASVNDTLAKVQNASFRLRSPGFEGTLAYAALITGTIDQGVWNASLNSSTVANGVYNITLNASDFAGSRLLVNTTNIVVNNSGFLNITINTPKGGSVNVTQNKTFSVNATITCLSGFCQQVNATVYYNITSISPSTRINATALEVPFHNVTTFVNQTCGYMDIDAVCSLNWTINATGEIGRYYYMSINFTSNNSETAQNGTSNFQINITEPVVTNTAPIVFNNSITLNSSVILNEGTTKEVTIRFNVTDTDTASDIVNAAVGVNISFNGVRRANNSGNCQNLGDSDANTRAFSCIVVFNYYDNSTTLWDINITAADIAGLVGYNDSQSLGGRDGSHNLTIESLSAFSLETTSVATTASMGDTNKEITFVINNTGNFDFTELNVTPFDLNASLTDFFKIDGNFSINASISSAGFGVDLKAANWSHINDSQGLATMPHKITDGESDFKANRTVFIYIDIPINKGLSTGVTYNVSPALPWQLFAS